MKQNQIQIGFFTEAVVYLLNLPIEAGTPIYLGSSNLVHMKSKHPKDFQKYGERIGKIIADPDYVGCRNDGSVEYIKAFGLHVKVAVRVAGDGRYYARSLYHIDEKVAKRLVLSGKWKIIEKSIDY